MLDSILTQLQSYFSPLLLFLADDPALRLLQSGMLFVGLVVIFLVFFTTRDILLRTHSFWYMFVCIVLVAALPVVGFLFYLLIRPARTVAQRELEEMLSEILEDHRSTARTSRRKPSDKKGGVVKKKSREEIAL